MNKGILMSIKPKWCSLISQGIKKGELRKGWFEGLEGTKVYLYCSSVKAMNLTDYCEAHRLTGGKIDDWSGKVFGEFICDRIDRYTAEFVDEKKHGRCYEDLRLHWEDDYDGELNFRRVTSNARRNPSDCDLCRDSCLTFEQIKAYIGENFHEKKFSFLHISELVIYDEPKAITSFIIPSKYGCVNDGKCRGCIHFDRGNGFNVEDDCCAPFCTDDYKPLRRPPQSWCYVEEI